jgi:hypothetical protein
VQTLRKAGRQSIAGVRQQGKLWNIPPPARNAVLAS